MPIKLEIKEYCQDCLDFEADVSKPIRMYANDDAVGSYGDTVIRCEYRNRCRALARYLEQKMRAPEERTDEE